MIPSRAWFDPSILLAAGEVHRARSWRKIVRGWPCQESFRHAQANHRVPCNPARDNSVAATGHRAANDTDSFPTAFGGGFGDSANDRVQAGTISTASNNADFHIWNRYTIGSLPPFLYPNQRQMPRQRRETTLALGKGIARSNRSLLATRDGLSGSASQLAVFGPAKAISVD